MSTITNLSAKVAKKAVGLGENQEAAFDPSTLVIIGEIITKVVELMQSCKKTPTDAAAKMRKPSWFDKIVLNLQVKKVLGGHRAYKKLRGHKLTEALVETGKEIKLVEVKDLYNEI